ncbi:MULTISPECIES: sirohydrochlorin chelatase [Bacillaceae]|uniref:Sirohydrochlorin chelatase n=1 Tax=Evansella alkalicola TaxID=745819 RepID=A0ABS6JMS9_9BACI|nr:sirohydrochlorin chelatase [Litchfieldia alkalitelluris]MBU9719871.1 sirohydrochlorin chelatase [Bacillus alkalicola]
MEAVVYAGHGSRTESGNRTFTSFVNRVTEKVDVPIQEIGFLESATPSIPDAIETAVRRGATSITVMPVLLMPGVHVNEDIPDIISVSKKQYENVQFHYGSPLGADELAIQTMQSKLPDDADGTIVLVGHGSRDSEAKTAFTELTNLFAEQTGFQSDQAFIKSTAPSISEKLQQLLEEGHQTIYLLPYLLFTGGFMNKIAREIAPFQASYGDCRIILCEPAGFDNRMESLLEKRVEEARTRRS